MEIDATLESMRNGFKERMGKDEQNGLEMEKMKDRV